MTIEIRFPQWEKTWLIYVIRKGLSFFLFFCWQRILDEFFVLPSFKRMEEYPNHSSFPTSFLSGRMKPMQLFGSPFSSPSPTWDDAPEVDKEAWSGSCSSGSLETLSPPRFWGSRSLFRDCRRIGFWNSGQILLTFWGGTLESIYVWAGFWWKSRWNCSMRLSLRQVSEGEVPTLVAEVLLYIDISPSQIDPLACWTLIAIQDGQLIDEEPLKGTKYRMPFGNRWNRSYLPTSIIRLGSIGEGRIDHCEEVETCFFLGESGGFVSLSYLG